jgi:hypothetical protein
MNQHGLANNVKTVSIKYLKRSLNIMLLASAGYIGAYATLHMYEPVKNPVEVQDTLVAKGELMA